MAELSDKAATAHDADADPDDHESLAKLKSQLSDSLSSLANPILVIMDDIDRLKREEIRLLFQLVKANADFPKMVYLLMFDRKLVEESLTGENGSSGRDYMEKIVQVGFDMPAVSPEKIDKVFIDGLNSLTSMEGADRNLTREYWSHLYVNGLRSFFVNLRDVHRFLSSFSFVILLFYKDKTLEVNPVDLVALECLRVFEPDVYHLLPANKDVLLGEKEALSVKASEDDDRRRSRLEAVIATASPPHREAVTQVLMHVFPETGVLLRGYARSSGFEKSYMKELRVCHRELFDRYFRLSVPETDIPQAVVDALLKATTDAAMTKAALDSLSTKGLLTALLRRIGAFTEELDAGRRTNLLAAVYDVGDSLPPGTDDVLDFGPVWLASAVLYGILSQVVDVKVRGSILLDALDRTTGVVVPIRQVSSEDTRHDKERGTSAPLVDAESLKKAQELCVVKIRRAVRERAWGQGQLQEFLGRWLEWGDVSEVKAFVASLISSTEGALAFIDGFLSKTLTSSGGPAVASWSISLKSIRKFVDADSLTHALAPVMGDDVTDANRELASRYDRALQAYEAALAGKEGREDASGLT